MKILIVDDSRVMRHIVRRTLRQAGYGHVETVEAADGIEALAAVAAESPDLVLSDWNMPQMSGVELLQVLRGRGDQVDFGFVTSEGSAAMRERAAEAGARFVIAKPFTPDDLREHIEATASLGGPVPASRARVPRPHAVRTLLEGLLGRDVALSDGVPVAPGPDPGARVALYVDDTNRPSATAAGDLAFCAYVAAALGLVPAGGARDVVRDGGLTPFLDEVLPEVLNVLGSLFNVPDAPHVRLVQVYDDPSSVPPEVLRALGTPGLRSDHTVDVAGYGSGRLTLAVV
ncbi:MAG: response regulator [Nocardioidaceae bacterium]|nr:response regulator [Nocardioidaceae bacterium]